MLVQDAEILIAALHNPTAALQSDDSLYSAMKNITKLHNMHLSKMSHEKSHVLHTLQKNAQNLQMCNCQCRSKLYEIQQLVEKGLSNSVC